MKEQIVAGNSMMVKIDGEKVKELREQQGLTQLYIATAVQVTTDTISRWENKRYPSIKKENGLKLAEALDVELADILEKQNVSQSKSNSDISQTLSPAVSRKKYLLPFVLAIVMLLVCGYLFFIEQKKSKVSAKRLLPARTIAGQPFPVIVEVDSHSEDDIALILKESLPDNAYIVSTSPKVATGKNSNIKWIQKIHGKSVFAYMVKIEGDTTTNNSFSGTVSLHEGAAGPLEVTGQNAIYLGPHHWADTNGDNIISDHEILSVYDRYSGIDGLQIDIDLIERMWLGSGYQWQKKSKTFSILP